jgi:hypothetical protein
MARVFSRKDVDRMIVEAVAKATAPLLERIAVLEAELDKAKKGSSVVATCAQQGRSAFKFLMDSIHAHFSGGLSPSLLPSGP